MRKKARGATPDATTGTTTPPTTTGATSEKRAIVQHAQALERMRTKRRKVVKALTELDAEIRTTRKFLRDLTEPDPTEAYQPAPEPERETFHLEGSLMAPTGDGAPHQRAPETEVLP
jgi:hypothetical protein